MCRWGLMPSGCSREPDQPGEMGILALEGATCVSSAARSPEALSILLSVGIVAFVGGVSWMSKAEA